MNKYLACLPALLLLGFVMYKPVKEATQSELVNKNISFAVYKSSTYSSKVYNNSSALVHITIEKVNTQGQHTVVWDRVLDEKTLRQYPTMENASKQNVTVCNIDQKKEHLVAGYTLFYHSNGYELKTHNDTIVNDSSDKVNISL